MITKTIMNVFSTLGPFGTGTLIVGLIAVYVSTLDSEECGFKPYTTDFLAMALWGVSAVGALVFVGGRGILW